MDKIKLNLFLSKIQRLPMKQSAELLEQYQTEIEKIPFIYINQIFDFLDGKAEIVKRWNQSEKMKYDVLYLKLLTEKVMRISSSVLQELQEFNSLHPTIQIEIIDKITEQERYYLLKNYGDKLTPLGIQTIILALSEEHKKEMMIKYKNQILRTELKLIVSFIANLGNNQETFLMNIIDFLKELEKEQTVEILFGLNLENMRKYLDIQKDKINNLTQKEFIQFLSFLEGDLIISFSELYKEKFQEIPADVLMYQLESSISNPEISYQIWNTNSRKLLELSDTYFNLIVSRLKDEQRYKSLIDFKDRYNQMDLDVLLDLFAFDSDEMKVELFTQYHDKIKTLDGTKIIEYINQNISDRRVRNQLFLLYKDSITKLMDKEFINFIHEFSNNNLGYIYLEDEDSNEFKKEMVQFITSNFNERIKNIKLKNIPTLFKNSESELNLEYLDILEQKIKQLINNRNQLEEFMRTCWSDDIKTKIYQKYENEFSKLTAIDWYNLRNCINPNNKETKEFLLKCEIDSLDFIKEEDLTIRTNEIVAYLKENLIGRVSKRYSELALTNKKQLLKEYEELVIKVCESNNNQVILNESCEKLIVLLRILLGQKIISTEDTYYQLFKEYYMGNILNRLEIENENNKGKIINSLFYRIIKGKVETMDLLDITTLKGLIFFNKNKIGKDRLDLTIYNSNEIENFVQNLTEEQVTKFNQKQFKQICEKIKNAYHYDTPTKESIRNLAIRIYMTVGYEKALKLLDLEEIPFTRYEYIFEGIDIKKIELDENGCPIIPKKLQDFMFGSNLEDENTNINRLLTNKIPEFEQKFASIYNNWDTIYQELNGIVTVNRILKWFKEHKVILNPDEYRLSVVLNELQDDYSIREARNLYSDMKQRKYSTIPKISGSTEKYTYEMLDLDDPLGLIVGNLTRCCFLINGMSRSALFHSAQSKDGRIFVVRNQSGELIAQSWVWRNGNLVCFDNVETAGRNDYDELLKAYQEAAEKIILISVKKESAKEQVKLVTVGGRYSKMKLPEKQVPKAEIKLPRTENRIYTDAEEQFILFATKEQGLYYGDVKAEYKDEREQVQNYFNVALLDQNEKLEISKRLRSINYSKNGQVSQINIDDYCLLMLGEDWYIGITLSEDIDINYLSMDERAKNELITCSCNLEELLKSSAISVDGKSARQKVIRLLGEDE